MTFGRSFLRIGIVAATVRHNTHLCYNKYIISRTNSSSDSTKNRPEQTAEGKDAVFYREYNDDLL